MERSYYMMDIYVDLYILSITTLHRVRTIFSASFSVRLSTSAFSVRTTGTDYNLIKRRQLSRMMELFWQCLIKRPTP